MIDQPSSGPGPDPPAGATLLGTPEDQSALRSDPDESPATVQVTFELLRADRLWIHLRIWIKIIVVMTPFCAVVGWFAFPSVWLLAIVLIGYLWMAGRFYSGALGILLWPRVPVTLQLRDSGVEVRMGDESQSYEWSNLFALRQYGGLNVLWFREGGVVPVPSAVVPWDVLARYSKKADS